MSRKKIAGWLVPSFLVFVPVVAFLMSGQWRKGLVTEYEQTPAARSPRTAEEGSSPAQGETPPDDTVKKLVRTWNQGKVENIASLFAADGTLIIPTGSATGFYVLRQIKQEGRWLISRAEVNRGNKD